MSDSLTKAIQAEPNRFLKYVNWSRVRTPQDFMREFAKAFDTHIGRNALDFMSKKHWDLLLNASKTQAHFASIKRQELLTDFIKKSAKSLIKGPDKETNVKFKEVKTSKGKTYQKSYQKWTDSQEEFVKRYLDKSAKEIAKAYNAVFKAQRTVQSIIYKLRGLK